MNIICYIGFDEELLFSLLPWLKENPKRRLIFVEEGPRKKVFSQTPPQVKRYFYQSFLEFPQIAKKIAWKTLFQEVEIREGDTPFAFTHFSEIFAAVKRGVELVFGDAKDFALPFFKNALANLKGPIREALGLKGAFANIPALLVGAGPSLEKASSKIAHFRNKSLIFAAGTANQLLPIPPHIAFGLDGHTPMKLPFEKVPLVFQARLHSEPLKKHLGERLILPDSHFPFLSYLSCLEGLFDSGWTSGTMQLAFALLAGCNPIIFVGMDFAIQDGKKYAWGDGGQKEQNDFFLARSWLEKVIKEHPDRMFCDFSKAPILPDRDDLEEVVLRSIQALPILNLKERLSSWQEVFEELLLKPLWQVWEPLFVNEVEFDELPISLEEKLSLHKHIFFQNVIKAYHA